MAKPKGTGSTIAIAGHPLHAMLVNFPITFLMTLVATDLAYLWTKQAFWAQVSYWLILAGFVTGVVAALAGTLEFLLTPKIRKFVGSWMHFISGIMAVAVVGGNLVWRWSDPVASLWPWGLAFSLLNFVVVGLAGWLGGSLVFEHGIGVSPGDEKRDLE